MLKNFNLTTGYYFEYTGVEVFIKTGFYYPGSEGRYRGNKKERQDAADGTGKSYQRVDEEKEVTAFQ